MQSMVAAIIAVSQAAIAADLSDPRAEANYRFEPYSQLGQTVGCGVSFTALWKNGGELFGAAGSITFADAGNRQVGSMIKVNGFLGGTEQRNLAFAWLEVSGYGNTKRFARQVAQDSRSYFAIQKPDLTGYLLAANAARDGFRLGLNFAGYSLDATASVPAASESVQAQLSQCLRALAVPKG